MRKKSAYGGYDLEVEVTKCPDGRFLLEYRAYSPSNKVPKTFGTYYSGTDSEEVALVFAVKWAMAEVDRKVAANQIP